MLSTPPAFILSQDQTLKKCVCSKFNINLLAYISLFTVLKDLSIVLWMCLSLQTVSFKEFSRIVYVFHCSVIKVLICSPSCDSLFTISHHFIDVNSYFFFKQETRERRRRDLNPRAATNDLLPFQGSPFGQLGYFSKLPYAIASFFQKRFILYRVVFYLSRTFLTFQKFFILFK